MKVARLHGVGDVRIGEDADPVPAPGESLVRVTAVGLCGSDLHWFSEGGIGDATLREPLVLGHEFAGVAESGEFSGRLVAVDPARPCNECPRCLEGHRNLCPTVRFAGHGSNDGALRELVSWPTHLIHPVPDALNDADAAMLEPLGVGLHAHDLAKLRLGASVAVVGCGPIGLCLIQLARLGGAATVVAIEPLKHRREAAERLGADVVLDPADPEVAAQILAASGGRGVDVAFEVAGNNDAVGLSAAAARPGGLVVLAGIPGEDSTTFPAGEARRKGLTFKLSRRMKEIYPRVIAMTERGAIDVRSVVSDHFGLEEVSEAFTAAERRSGLKVIVAPHQ